MGYYPGNLCSTVVLPDFNFHFHNIRSTLSCEHDLDHKCIEILTLKKMNNLAGGYIAE